VVVLVEPAGPLNVGSVARLCANFAIAQLRLVAPRCNHLGEEARRMAVHGQAQLEQAVTYPDLASAIADCRRVVATSGRLEREELPLEGPGSALGWLIEPEGDPGVPIGPPGSIGPRGFSGPGGTNAPGGSNAPVALVFGREDRGLSNDELLQAGKILRLESSADYASLNLSHAVAICLHELRRIPASTAPPGTRSGGQGPAQAPLLAQADSLAWGDPDGGAGPAAEGSLAASAGPGATSLRGALEATLADGQELLLQVGFLHPHTAHARMAKLRGLLQRAQIREGEVALIRGMVRQLRWATTRRTP
jgi:tRNA/rRNA methyltransferase